MKNSLLSKVSLGVWLCLTAWTIAAQQSGTGPEAVGASSAVPRLINYSGVLKDANEKPLSGVTGVTFLLYKDEQGGAPLWLETQNVTPDKNGRYTVMLGATTSQGLRPDVFANAEARWLGVQVEGQAERPRVLLVAVPYALKAADADTLGGKPASAFVAASDSNASSAASNSGSGRKVADSGKGEAMSHADARGNSSTNLTGSGRPNYIPLWTTSTNLGSSVIYESASHNIGIGTTSPQAPLTVTTASSSSPEVGIFGQATATSGSTFGVEGKSASSSGVGVLGKATAASGNTIGVQGYDISSSGIGVFGQATATSGSAFGVEGESASSSGHGVQGNATATSGDTIGVAGESASSSGYGVQGKATATSGTAVGVVGGSLSSSGIGVVGRASATSGNTIGVGGISLSSSGIGVVGQATATSGDNVGTEGLTQSPKGVGVYGVGIAPSLKGSKVSTGRPFGVWGDTNQVAIAVLGTADDGDAVVALNNSPKYAALGAANYESVDPSVAVFLAKGVAFGGQCGMDVSGNLLCTGTKSAAVPLADGRKVALYAVEAPENWFEDAGSGKLTNGIATVSLEPTFAETVNTAIEYHVFLTPKGDCEGLYVANETLQGFEVRELHAGHSDVIFDYRIMARRKGYEKIRLADVTEQLRRPLLTQ